jgi:putative oxidoreductase
MERMKPPAFLTAFHAKFYTVTGWLQSPLLLVIRFYWGWEFFLTGKGKLMNLDRTTEFFASIDIPLPKLNAILAASTECFGGLLLMAGLMSRLSALPLAFTMIVAYATTEQEALGKLFKEGDAEEFLKAAPFLFMLAALIVLAFGPGKIALDTFMDRWCSCGSGACEIKTKPSA